MSIRDDIGKVEDKMKVLEKEVNNNKNFDLGNTFRNIIYFLLLLITILVGVIIFFIIKNNELAKEMSEYTCETDVMEQEGVYNFIDSEGNMITTDADVLNKFIEEYYGKAKESD